MGDDSYRNQLRIRVNGLLVENDSVLLVKLYSPVTQRTVWMPPGGGLHFGESLKECLCREYREETSLEVTVGQLRYIHELVEEPYHAIEFYFDVSRQDGKPRLGNDPERSETDQLLADLKFIPFEELARKQVAPAYLKTDFVKDYKSDSTEIRYSDH